MRDVSWSEKLSLYESWYNADMPSLFGYLFYQTQDRELAQELTASTCLRALERLNQFDSRRGNLKDWIFGIARNQLREHLRTQRRRPTPVTLSDAVECLMTDDGLELDYDQQETLSEVLNHIDCLGEREREIGDGRRDAAVPVGEAQPEARLQLAGVVGEV